MKNSLRKENQRISEEFIMNSYLIIGFIIAILTVYANG